MPDNDSPGLVSPEEVEELQRQIKAEAALVEALADPGGIGRWAARHLEMEAELKRKQQLDEEAWRVAVVAAPLLVHHLGQWREGDFGNVGSAICWEKALGEAHSLIAEARRQVEEE